MSIWVILARIKSALYNLPLSQIALLYDMILFLEKMVIPVFVFML